MTARRSPPEYSGVRGQGRRREGIRGRGGEGSRRGGEKPADNKDLDKKYRSCRCLTGIPVMNVPSWLITSLDCSAESHRLPFRYLEQERRRALCVPLCPDDGRFNPECSGWIQTASVWIRISVHWPYTIYPSPFTPPSCQSAQATRNTFSILSNTLL